MLTIGCDGGGCIIYGGLESPTVFELHGHFRWFSVDAPSVGRGDVEMRRAQSGEQRLCGERLSRVHSCHENGVKQGGEEA